MNNPRDFIRQFEDGLSVSDSLCTAAPSPQKRIGEGVSVGEGATVHETVPGPVFLMIGKDCTERLSAVALSIGLIIPRG